MLIITGQQFQCATTTCLPFTTVTTSSIRKCQMTCLAQEHCRASSFHQSTFACELFTDVSSQTGNMLSNLAMTTILIIDGTRNPPERTTTTTTTSTTTSSTTTSTTTSSTTTSMTTTSTTTKQTTAATTVIPFPPCTSCCSLAVNAYCTSSGVTCQCSCCTTSNGYSTSIGYCGSFAST
ncbi:hypothetical protein I4U23_017042 [Adineta vaga]|nr:hypothetical protein I4U23_017042 [Adineta vaga]